MEEVKPFLMSSSQSLTTSSDKEAAESRFTEFCKNMPSLDESMCRQSMELFKETLHLMQTSSIGSVTAEESERYWFAFVLYSVIRLSKKNTDNEQKEAVDDGYTLCRILRLAKLNIVDFFKELPQYIIKAESILCSKYGTDWQSRLEMKEMQANFVHLILLSQYYKRTHRELFSTSGDEKPAVGSTTEPGIDYQRFGWFLFLALRRHTFGRFKDLVTCVNGLVSVLAILIIHVPTRFRKFNISDEPRFARKTEKGVDLIGSLCDLHETTEQALRQTLDSTNKLIIDLLHKTPKSASECSADSLANINPDSLVYFEDLMEESSLSSSLSALEKDYENAVSNKGELEVFANEEDSILGSGSLSGGNVNITGAKRKFETFASPTKSFTSPLSPHRSPTSHVNGIIGGSSSRVANTPVSTAMTTAKWLRTVISPLPSNPSTELQRFMTSCDRDVTTDVVRRAQIILEAIFPSSTVGDRSVATARLMDNIWAEQRRLEACKLYYRVLEAMCRAEVQVLHSNNLTSLLTNERFHRCMLSCSAELVLATHKTVTMLFPAVLERTGITAFDLSKVIESFIRHEETLPRELKRHLNSLEERLLESMVWEKGSSMYNSLIVARPALSADINRLVLLAEPMPSLDAIAVHINFSSSGLPAPTSGQNGEMRSPKRPSIDFRSVLVERNSFTSPVKDRLLALSNLKSKMTPPPPLQSAFASPNRPNPGGGGETCAETGINIFFSKIMKLAAVRINGMLERLQLPQHMKENVYRLFQQILNRQTSLFFNRHIDQIILCCFYGVAKISQINLTFRDIICNYRKQPHCKPQVFRTVFIDSSSMRRNGRAGHEHVDIITFYNEVFVPCVKPFLVELGPVGAPPRTDRAPEVNNADNDQCPGSPPPKRCQFPTVPDMSPKKVSPAHNIYVSPMRSSKMDASISHHSAKSYYACVGESTHAYQSPSKDLAAINNRLNGPRKVKAALEFDVDVGLVSDSMVASSLYLQNAGTTPKMEKSDS